MNKSKTKVHYDMNSKITDLNDENHPLRIMAKRIVCEVFEINTGSFLPKAQALRMENDIVALLTNLD